ncbi:MAG: acylphosphatase [Chitinispirillaceae bacterium]|jgi:acylphosphatase
MNTTPIKRINAVVEGRVQGVGFRYFTRDRALRHGITGWVRNLPGHNVELEAQGTGDNVDAFIAEIRKGPALSHVSDVKIHDVPLENKENGFEITF